jgi:hypothetical protein
LNRSTGNEEVVYWPINHVLLQYTHQQRKAHAIL